MRAGDYHDAVSDVDPGFRVLLRRALRLRCPACGEGRLFDGFARVRRKCAECSWVLEREPGASTGAMYLTSVVSQFFAVGLWLVLWWVTDWSTGVMVAIAIPMIAIFSLATLPHSKSLWIAVEYYTDLASGDSAEPEYRERAFHEPVEPD